MPKTLTEILTLIGGTCWTVVYLLIIIRSYRDKTYGMPYWTLAFNISWEAIFSFLLSTDLPDLQLQLFINRIWLFFDLLILIAYFRYGKKEWPTYLPRSLFYPYSLLVLVIGFLFVYLISVELDHSLGVYAAFIQNFMMSWLFIVMLNNRKSSEGQSISIAAFKLIGTLAPTIIYGAKSAFVLYLGAGCFVADLIYLFILVQLRGQSISNEKKSYPRG